MTAPRLTRRALAAIGALAPLSLAAAAKARPASDIEYTSQELVDSGHRFFGSTSRGLAGVVENAASRWGHPTAYVLGQEGSGALFAGLRYGEGKLFMKTRPTDKIYWQGPSLGWDVGGDGDRTMMLIYNMRQPDDIYRRFGGVDGSAYFVGGFGMTALSNGRYVVVPIRTGVGARLGVNVSYLKFTDRSTWNPF